MINPYLGYYTVMAFETYNHTLSSPLPASLGNLIQWCVTGTDYLRDYPLLCDNAANQSAAVPGAHLPLSFCMLCTRYLPRMDYYGAR